MAGLVPISAPFMGPWPMPDDESAVPRELVPGVAALVPKAPPVTDMCDPIPAPPRASAAVVERLTQRATQIAESFFIPRFLRHTIKRRMSADAHEADVGSQSTVTIKLNFMES